MKLSGSTFSQIGARLIEPALRNVEYHERRLKSLAAIAIVAFPSYYFVWHDLFPQPYENLPLRLAGTVLFVPVFFSKRWPEHLKHFLPYYWYFVLLYSLPFFFTFMLLKNNISNVWIGSAQIAIFIMIVMLDWVTLIAHSVLGISLAVVAVWLTTDGPITSLQHYEYGAIALFAVVIGAMTNFDSERIRIEQDRAMLATASSIAHELRTPLLSIRAGVSGLAKYMPTLIEAYQLARDHSLPVRVIRKAHLDELEWVLDRIDIEAYYSNAVIDMLLINARFSDNVAQDLVPCSMTRCVQTALDRYPFSEGERARVSWESGGDFVFRGNELLTVHILFNLIKNALRHIDKAGKGQITLDIQPKTADIKSNRLIFRDTGDGIPPESLPYIFMRFYTSNRDSDSVLGAGIGLAFCRDVMQAFGGAIECTSQYGEYSQFVLTFPSP